MSNAKILGTMNLSPVNKSSRLTSAWHIKDRIKRIVEESAWLDNDTGEEYLNRSYKAGKNVEHLRVILTDLEAYIEGQRKAYSK